MRILSAGPMEILVSIQKNDFEGLTGIKVGDYYGNGGISYDRLAGREYNISKSISAMHDMRIAAEVKNKVIDELEKIKSKISSAYFPLADFEAPQVVLVEPTKGKKK